LNRDLALIIRDAIKTLPFVDKATGLVKTIEQERTSEDGKTIVIRFPASLDVEEPLAPGQYSDCTPDDKYKSVFFVEDRGGRSKGKDNRGAVSLTSTLRLVGWLNSRFKPGADGLAIMNIIKAIPERPANTDLLKNITCTAGAILGVEDRIFGRYTFEERTKQYLMSPYTAFAIDYTFEYQIGTACLPEYE